MDTPIPARRPELVITKQRKKKRKRTYRVDLAVQADHEVKMKESEMRDKYLDHDRELKNLRNMIYLLYDVKLSKVYIN